MEEVKYRPVKVETINKQGLKSSQEKSFRKQLLESIPKLEQIIDQIWTKKTDISSGKLENFRIYFLNNEPCFLQAKEGPIIPHLKLLHKYPFLLPTCQVDEGGIKHLISGADVMIPGMTSKGGKLPTEKVPNRDIYTKLENRYKALPKKYRLMVEHIEYLDDYYDKLVASEGGKVTTVEKQQETVKTTKGEPAKKKKHWLW